MKKIWFAIKSWEIWFILFMPYLKSNQQTSPNFIKLIEETRTISQQQAKSVPRKCKVNQVEAFKKSLVTYKNVQSFHAASTAAMVHYLDELDVPKNYDAEPLRLAPMKNVQIRSQRRTPRPAQNFRYRDRTEFYLRNFRVCAKSFAVKGEHYLNNFR